MTPNSPGLSANRGLTIKPSGTWDQAFAGQWLPITFDMVRSTEDARPLQLENITSEDHEISLDIDLLQPRLEIRPGETYRCTVPIRVMHPRKIDLGSIRFTFSEKSPQSSHVVHFKMPSRQLIIKPAIGQEIVVQVKTVCQYDQNTKVMLTLNHQGKTTFQDLTVTLGPGNALLAGKPILQRQQFGDGAREQLELVLTGKELEVVLAATAHGNRVEARITKTIEPLPPQEEKTFRFLEPTRLAKDTVRIFRMVNDERLLAEQRRETFFLERGNKYRLEIQPRQSSVHEVKLNDPWKALKREKQGDTWVFTIEVVAGPDLFRKEERLYYEMETEKGKLTGEIPLCVKPSRWRHLQIAGYLGVVATFQGAMQVAQLVLKNDVSILDVVDNFHRAEYYRILYILSIPLAWVGLRFADWVQYQFTKL
jgi:hypothetical protein